ncbi:hypothetical protein L3X38_011679 [Prunus dulcis]|uniref:Retrovirus-related Pol polyprotein from transposon TNT 1-94-like beta-barrel domain-containing protein n=1 Tax=Prunus dulcis TaxID=3755 RepID=A0AAD4WHT8_PRUDU|nr:hypothetical protein L3X38_011679 [Prunus dulcis]
MVGSSMGKLRAPIFNGSNYDFWRIKMCTIFKSHKLWDMVENYASRKEEKGIMFYACHAAEIVKNNGLWYVDSACSNHMTSHASLLVNIDTKATVKVKMGTGDLVQATGQMIEHGYYLVLGNSVVEIFDDRSMENLVSKGLKLLQQQELVYGLPKIGNADRICQDCAIGKSHNKAFGKEKTWRASIPLELVHSDVCGPM